MADFKPFSIYDEDEGERKPLPNPQPASPEGGDLGLEMEDVPSEDDAATRQALMSQLGMAHPENAAPTEAPKLSASLEKTPFLQGQSGETVEDRAKDIIRKRQESGKIRDRRKVASIFDKPIEPDRPLERGKAAWHPLSHWALSFWFLFPALVLFGAFFLYPTIMGFQISLTHYSPLGE